MDEPNEKTSNEENKLNIHQKIIMFVFPILTLLGTLYLIQLSEPNSKKMSLDTWITILMGVVGLGISIMVEKKRIAVKGIIILLGFSAVLAMWRFINIDLGQLIGFYLGGLAMGIKSLRKIIFKSGD